MMAQGTVEEMDVKPYVAEMELVVSPSQWLWMGSWSPQDNQEFRIWHPHFSAHPLSLLNLCQLYAGMGLRSPINGQEAYPDVFFFNLPGFLSTRCSIYSINSYIAINRIGLLILILLPKFLMKQDHANAWSCQCSLTFLAFFIFVKHQLMLPLAICFITQKIAQISRIICCYFWCSVLCIDGNHLYFAFKG